MQVFVSYTQVHWNIFFYGLKTLLGDKAGANLAAHLHLQVTIHAYFFQKNKPGLIFGRRLLKYLLFFK